MKNLFTFILILVLGIIAYKIFVKINAPSSKKSSQTHVAAKRNPSENSTTSADQNPVRRTRIGKKLDNLYDKHNKYSTDALD